MDVNFDCPHCKQHLAVDQAGAGMTVNCPTCNEKIEIPRSTAPQVLKVSVPPAAPPIPKLEQVKYEASTDTFKGTSLQVAKLAMRAIQALGWKLDNVNETLGLVTFETGMTLGSWSGVSGSLSIEEVAENQFRLTGTAKQNLRGGQFVALNLFGEAQGKVNQVFQKMRELAGGQGPQRFAKCPYCRKEVVEYLETCPHCRMRIAQVWP
jgi:DNA-directed RNA polymerase subunit RPC12/RpoP